MMLNCSNRYFVFCFMFSLLVGCGGGAGGSDTPQPSSLARSSVAPQSSSLISSGQSSITASIASSEISSAVDNESSLSSDPLSSSSSSSSSSSRMAQVYFNSGTMFRQAAVVENVVGFENVAAWSTNGGTQSLHPAISEGQHAIQYGNFQNLKISSQPLNTLRGIGEQLSVDVVSVTDLSIEIKLTLSIPSLGIYQQALPSSVSPVLKAAQITRLDFVIPDNIKTHLNNEYSDLVFEFTLSSSAQVASLTFDNLRFNASTVLNVDKVEIELDRPDDFVYLMVNGIQRRVWSNHIYGNTSTGRIDITSLFWQGLNTVRVQGINSGGWHQLTFTLWVNGERVIYKDCPPKGCGNFFEQGIFYDSVFVFNTPTLPSAKILTVDSPTGANIYIDDLFISKQVPAKLRLPQGDYTIGAGEFADAPFNYRSSFYERNVQLRNANHVLSFGSADRVGVQNTTRVAIVPIRSTKVTGFSRTGVLTESDIDFFRNNVQMANDKSIVPLSYGLQQWHISVLPVVENITLELPTLLAGFGVGELLTRAGLDSIKSQYEIIIVHYSGYDVNRLRIDNGGGAGASAGDGYIIVPNVWPLESHRPHGVILHEALHVYEQAQRNLQYLYNGANGLHGAEVHGYTPLSPLGEEDWVGWYRMFMRNAAVETMEMRDLNFRYIPAEVGDVQVGVFDTMRHGLGFLH